LQLDEIHNDVPGVGRHLTRDRFFIKSIFCHGVDPTQHPTLQMISAAHCRQYVSRVDEPYDGDGVWAGKRIMRAIVKKWGNSAAVRIPRGIMQAARLTLDEVVDVREHDGQIVIEPIRLGKVDLAQLPAGIASAAPLVMFHQDRIKRVIRPP
jgi:antitoxin MazE